MDTSFSLPSSIDMSDVMPSLKRTSAQMSGTGDFLTSAIDAFSSKRFAGHGSFESQFRAAVPDQLAAGMHFMDTGEATSDQQTDQIVVVGNLLRSFDDGAYEQSYVSGMPLWVSSIETQLDGEYNAHTMASPAVLNYLFELRAIADNADALVRRGDTTTELTKLVDRYSELMASTAEDAAKKWSLLGNMVSSLDSSRYANSTSARIANGAGERLIGTSTTERSRVFNGFAQSLREGDRAFWTFRDADLSWSTSLLNPNGHSVVARAALASRTLQVVGFSNRETDVIGHDTSARTSMFEFSNPTDDDLDYIHRARRLASDWFEYDWDDELGHVEVRQEGGVTAAGNDRATIQKLVSSVPTIVYDQYMHGYPVAAGIVRNVDAQHVSIDDIRAGMRSNEAMKALPLVTMYTSLH